MNELVYVRDSLNVVDAQFLHHGVASGKIYSWYISDAQQKVLHDDQIESIKTAKGKRKVHIIQLRFELTAKEHYQPFHQQQGAGSWQVQRICFFLAQRGYRVYRERHFKGLINRNGTPLRADIAFEINGHWVIIEYNGVHHYLSEKPGYQNLTNNMQVKRQWCRDQHVPLLEIPYWWQGSLESLVDGFLKAVLAGNKM